VTRLRSAHVVIVTTLVVACRSPELPPIPVTTPGVTDDDREVMRACLINYCGHVEMRVGTLATRRPGHSLSLIPP